LSIDDTNHPILILIDLFSHLYLFASIIVPITEAKIESFTGISENKSFSKGVQAIDGSLRVCFDISRNHFVFTTHHTYTAHSGSIPSLPINLSSLFINERSSSTLAVIICERYSFDTKPSSVCEIFERSISLSLNHSFVSSESSP